MTLALRNLLVCLPLLGMGGGCSYFPYMVKNLTGAPLEFVACARFRVEAHKLADQAWVEAVARCPARAESKPYACGFKDGFVDFIDRNGSGEPPAIPPRSYRYPILRTPEQQQAIDDWYAGFRDGAEVARAQGWRNGVIVPLARPPLLDPVGFHEEIVPTPSMVPPTPAPPEEELPPPRVIPKEAPEPPPASGGAQLGLPVPTQADEAVMTREPPLLAAPEPLPIAANDRMRAG